MRPATRVAGLAVIAALAATVSMVHPDAAPRAAAQARPGGAAQATLPADLALVPADAIGFVHVRAADVWKNEALAPFRQIFEKAGPKVLGALDGQFVPKVSTFDRVTGFIMFNGKANDPLPFGVLRFTAAFDPDAVVKSHLPEAEKLIVGGKTVYADRQTGVAVYFPDNQHIMLGTLNGLAVYLGHAMPKEGAMSHGLKLAAGGRAVVGSVNLAALPIPPKFLEELPPDVRPLLKADHVTASVDLGAAARLELTAGYKTAADAQAAEKAVKALAEYARKELAKVKDDLEKKFLAAQGPRPATDLPEALMMVFAIGAANFADELLANPGAFIKRNGADLTASVDLNNNVAVVAGGVVAVGVGLLLPAVQKVRSAAARMQSSNNLKQIGIAVHAYHDVNNRMPGDIIDKNGKPLLSWRVAILPYIEQNALYNKFKLDEPWDSPNNKPLSHVLIKTFMSPNAPFTPEPGGYGVTHYQALAGPGAIFEPGARIRMTDITDGTSNTIMVVEGGGAVPWAKPGDIPFDPKKPLPKLESAGTNGLLLSLFGDGSVRAIKSSIGEKTLKALITRNGGEVVNADD